MGERRWVCHRIMMVLISSHHTVNLGDWHECLVMAVITTKQPHMAAKTPVFPDFSLLLLGSGNYVSQSAGPHFPSGFLCDNAPWPPPLAPPFPASLLGKCWNRRHNDSSLSRCSSNSSLSVATQLALSHKPYTATDPPGSHPPGSHPPGSDPPGSDQRRHPQLIIHL